MSKNKSSDTKKIDKLRKILDNHNDPEVKKDKSLNSIHRRLSAKEPLTPRRINTLQDSSPKTLKPKYIIYKREPEIEQPKKEPIKTKNRIDIIKEEQIKKDVSKKNDLIEIKKIEIPVPKFLKIVPKKTKEPPLFTESEKKPSLSIEEKFEEIKSVPTEEKFEEIKSEPAEEKIEEIKSESTEEKPSDELLFCGECGTKLKKGENFCGECGKNISTTKAVKLTTESTAESTEEDVVSTAEQQDVERTDESELEFYKVIPEDKIKEYKDVLDEIGELSKVQEYDKKLSDITDKKTLEHKIIKTRKSEEKEEDELIIEKVKPGRRVSKKEITSKDKIRLFHPLVVAEMWLFTIILGVLFILGIFLIRDWLFDSFGVYGEKFIPTIDGAFDLHLWFGFALMIFGLLHIVIHMLSKKKKDILTKQTGRDFKAFLHSGIYLIGLARREDYGTSERYNGRQRIVYISLVYILSLTILTGILYYFHLITHDISMVHVIPAGLSIMVLLFHFLITIRKHDLIALKSAFLTGKIPMWYARKNHPIWYENFRSKREKITGKMLDPTISQTDRSLIKGGSNLANAVAKFALLLDDSPDKNMIEAITEELRNKHSSDEMQRIIELADELDKEIEIEVKQEEKDIGESIEPEKSSVTKEEPGQSTEEQKEGIESNAEELKKVEKIEVSQSEEKIEGQSNESTPGEKSDVEPKAIEEPMKEEKTEDVKKPKVKEEVDEIKKKGEKTELSEDEEKKES
ncbi:MAG: hypothetical protein JSU91_01215 [Thermoplasmatales archaeon]|nr:MAG: hypothetical protein JSU91_01215 [Thermoplasmatales archaeon]